MFAMVSVNTFSLLILLAATVAAGLVGLRAGRAKR